MKSPIFKIISPSEKHGSALIDLTLKIENFSPNDMTCVKELWRESQQSENEPDRYHFLIAKRDNQLLGFACYGHRPLTTGTFDFYWLGVDPEFRNLGIARALTNKVESEIKLRKGYLVIVETSSLNAFSTARAFYVSCGYQIAAQIPDFYHPGDDLVIFTKKLDPSA